MADLKSGGFILSDCPKKNFLRASIRIKEPGAVFETSGMEGQFRADVQHCGSVSLSNQRCIS